MAEQDAELEGEEGRVAITGDDTGAEANPEAESRARELGWVPEEEFRGDKTKWKPAEDFLDYADHMLPILRENNKKLTQKISAKDQEFARLNAKVAEQDKILKTLEAAADIQAEASLEVRLDNTRQALAEANREGDFEKVAELQEALTDLKLEQRVAKDTKVGSRDEDEATNRPAALTSEQQADFAGWKATNKWVDDPTLAAASNVIGAQIIQEALDAGETPKKGRAFLDEVTKRMDNKFNISKRGRGDKVDSGGTNEGGGTQGSGGASYAALPAEAKRMCEAQAKKFVGADKQYKTLAQWQKRFATLYAEQG